MPMEAKQLAGKKLVFAPILRAGMGFIEGMLDLVPSARVAHIGLVNLTTFAVRKVSVGAEPTRVRWSPDGSTALVLSDRSKVAWVVR